MIPLEIERKFLIRQSSQLNEACCSSIAIVQTYLVRDDPSVQRRVRSMDTDGDVHYFYTEKRFISAAVREENEREISFQEYSELEKQADKELVPIIKTRRILEYKGQRFEIDSYPFSAELATMELELPSEDTPIDLPDFVDIIKEVTGDENYSNANLAKAQRFPQ